MQGVGGFFEWACNAKSGFLKRGFKSHPDKCLVFENEAAATIHVILQREAYDA
jgi:hypothetical protein